MKGVPTVKYVKPELEWIRFENSEILTTSNGEEMPIIPFEEGDFNE